MTTPEPTTLREALAKALNVVHPTWPTPRAFEEEAGQLVAALEAAGWTLTPLAAPHGIWSHGPNISEVEHCPEAECVAWRTTPHFYQQEGEK